MDEYIYELKIPKERVAVLIGKDGGIKKEIEQATKTELKIDSKEGDVYIKGGDALGLYSCREVVIAIARGFNPTVAELLLNQGYCLETIQIADYVPTKNSMLRVKGRVIGKEGKARRLIEELTGTNVSVYGKTISIIGEPEFTNIAYRAIISLLKGSPHAKVYQWLEKKRRQLKFKSLVDTEVTMNNDGTDSK